MIKNKIRKVIWGIKEKIYYKTNSDGSEFKLKNEVNISYYMIERVLSIKCTDER